MKAIILAGGKGSRIQSISKNKPKCLVKIGNKTILDHIIDNCLQCTKIDDIIIVTHHLSELIDSHIKDREIDVSIRVVKEETPLGTAGALHSISDELNDDFLVIYGDIMMNMDLSRLGDYHHKKKSYATLVVHPNDHPYDSDLVECDKSGRITNIFPKPHDEGYKANCVSAACYCLSSEILSDI
ncbi:D,D-heptose 1,7-bisphosphate phosphatase, partial [Candidatus Marinamargulisbacteria bacterium SCGC AG-343-D04]